MPMFLGDWTLIAIFAVVGAWCRYAITLLTASYSVPLGTIIVNVLGSFLAGLLYSLPFLTQSMRLGLIVGGMGALTTFSTFTLQAVEFSQRHQWLGLFATFLANNVLSFAACLVGVVLSRKWGL